MLVAIALLAYLSGSVPWAVWLGQIIFHADVRSVGDGNPGAVNAYRVGGMRLAALVVVLDFLKASLPVFVARWGLHYDGYSMALIALMPTLGHAFSVFLRFRGGRALVTLFGVWSALTLHEVPLVMGGAAAIATLLSRRDQVRTLAVPASAIIAFVLRSAPLWMLLLAIGQLVIVCIKLGSYYSSARFLTQRAQATREER